MSEYIIVVYYKDGNTGLAVLEETEMKVVNALSEGLDVDTVEKMNVNLMSEAFNDDGSVKRAEVSPDD